MSNTFDLGLVGLGTMGHSLMLNVADHGHKVIGLDTDAKRTDPIHSQGGRVDATTDPKAFVASIRKPRAILMLVPAGGPVDSVIATLSPFLEEGDFIIDGGNSHYKDTDRRAKEMAAKNLGFMGMGVSGGESGARHGPSMMPGGRQADYDRVGPLLEAIAAKYQGEPCVALTGAGSAGHYVKTVHNGIEYGQMQLIAEIYDFHHRGAGMTNAHIADLFATWNEGTLQSFLVEITTTVLRRQDPETGRDLVDVISDKAKQKGTGKWTSQDAMDLGVPIPTIDVAVAARETSGAPERAKVAAVLGRSQIEADLSNQDLHDALYLCSILTYCQGMALLRVASKEYGYGTNLETIARIWRAGCIIRSHTLELIRAAFSKNPDLENLMLDDSIRALIFSNEDALRRVVTGFINAGIPAPCLSASLAYLDTMRSSRLPSNLIQGQRDLFGAHTYERIDKPGSFHTQWESE